MKKDYTKERIELKRVPMPELEDAKPYIVSEEVMIKRKTNVLKKMSEQDLDVIVIYADMEHSYNFEYLCGFVPRFEEALLILHVSGDASLMLGNEVLSLAKHSRIPAKAIHIPCFSLPDQPDDEGYTLHEGFIEAGIQKGMRIGVVGWKGIKHYQSQLLDLPHYIVEELKQFHETIQNATAIFTSPSYGVRTINGVEEIRHYEYGQMLASNGILQALHHIREGVSEIEIAQWMESQGQPHNVVTICSSGKRFVHANIYPSIKKIVLGDRMSLTVGYKGGLVSRAAYAVYEASQLPKEKQGYEEQLAKPYFKALCAWLHEIHVGMSGHELYELVNEVLPKEIYHWKLNPGHLAGDEEWMSSIVYKNASDTLKSGMIFQIDIIPRIDGYDGCCCENGIVLADKTLRKEIQNEQPEMWERMMKRRAYIQSVLKIELHEDVLPLSNTVAYYTPYLLNKEKAFTVC